MPDRFLLDTHALIWYQGDNPKMPEHAVEKMRNSSNTVFFSQVNLYEIIIKQTIGKLPSFKASIEDVYNTAINDGFTFLPIQNHHLYNYEQIPLFESHRDPFDRLLISTAYTENLVIITADRNFSLYNELVKVFW